MIEINEDDEPEFHVRFYKGNLLEKKDQYWEQYDAHSRSWIRLCEKCTERVWKPLETLCLYHYKRQNKTRKQSKTTYKDAKQNLKRLKTRINGRKKQQKSQLNEPVVSKTEETVHERHQELKDSLEIFISISSALNKDQISHVKEFMLKFNSQNQSIQFTCESQPDYVDDTTTHVITHDSGSFSTLITKQIIQACVRHIFIGSMNWIMSSIERSTILDYFPYEILRVKSSPKDSRGIKQCRFDQLPVFPSSSVMSVECYDGIKDPKMTREELIEVVELSGATLLNDYLQYSALIILCNSKKEVINRKKKHDNSLLTRNEKTIHYCKPEYLFDSIVRHEVQPVERYAW